MSEERGRTSRIRNVLIESPHVSATQSSISMGASGEPSADSDGPHRVGTAVCERGDVPLVGRECTAGTELARVDTSGKLGVRIGPALLGARRSDDLLAPSALVSAWIMPILRLLPHRPFASRTLP